MLLLQITSSVTAITLVVLVLCLLPVLAELKKTVTSLRAIAESFDAEIKPLIKELHKTVSDIQVVASSAADNVDGVTMFLDELGHAGRNIRMINKVLGIATEVVATSSAWMTGARVAGKVIADRLMQIKKRG